MTQQDGAHHLVQRVHRVPPRLLHHQRFHAVQVCRNQLFLHLVQVVHGHVLHLAERALPAGPHEGPVWCLPTRRPEERPAELSPLGRAHSQKREAMLHVGRHLRRPAGLGGRLQDGEDLVCIHDGQRPPYARHLSGGYGQYATSPDRGLVAPDRYPSISPNATRCRPWASKLSSDSHFSRRRFTRGHSESSIEYQQVSRLRPLYTMAWRNMPS